MRAAMPGTKPGTKKTEVLNRCRGSQVKTKILKPEAPEDKSSQTATSTEIPVDTQTMAPPPTTQTFTTQTFTNQARATEIATPTNAPQADVAQADVAQADVSRVKSADDSDASRPLSYADLRRFSGLVFGLAFAGLLGWLLGPVLLLFAVVFLLAMVLNPLVVGLERRGLKRGLAVVVVMLGLLGVVAGVIWLIVPPILEQINALVAKAPAYGKNIREQSQHLMDRYPFIERSLPKGEEVQKQAQQWGAKAVPILLSSTIGLLGAIFGLVVSLLLLVFTLGNPHPLVGGLLSLTPARHREAVRRSMARMMQQMAVWSRATIINGLITGVSTGLILHFIGVQPALVFGVLAFFGEFIPNIGPLVASLPALFVALAMGPDKAMQTLLAILFVQQVESNVLVPFIMGREMELHPVTITFFALGMAAMFGIVGAVLAVPTAALCKILIDEFYLRPRRAAMAGIDAQAQGIIDGTALPKEEAVQ